MELDAFTSRLGLGRGRVQPRAAPPGGGDWAFVLGEDEATRFFELTEGDHADVVEDDEDLDDDERDEPRYEKGTAANDVFIVEGQQLRYGSKAAWDAARR